MLDQSRSDPCGIIPNMDKLFEFCSALDRLHIPVRSPHRTRRRRDGDGGRSRPVHRSRVFRDGSVEIERFLSQGVEEASDAAIEEVLRAFSE